MSLTKNLSASFIFAASLFVLQITSAQQPTSLPPSPSTPDIGSIVDEVIENYRRVIVLHESAPAKLPRDRMEAGHTLFYRNRQLTAQLVSLASADEATCNTFMDVWVRGQGGGQGGAQLSGTANTKTQGWMEVDRLALGGVMTELSLQVPRTSTSTGTCAARLRAATREVNQIRLAYSREVTATLDNRADTVAGNRPKWVAYVASLKSRYDAKAILDSLKTSAPPVEGVRPSATARALAGRAVRDEWTDGDLPKKTVLLTFDDGPHPLYTPRILDILLKYNIRAIFFMIGSNIGSLDSEGNVTLREPELIARILREGHVIANHTHTHTHPLMPKLDEINIADEIDLTEVLLNAAIPSKPDAMPNTLPTNYARSKLFRPPYGARNDLVLAEIAARGLRSVLWNIDSRDWADPIARSVASRTLAEVDHEGRGIILFHDIHPQTIDAVPIVIEGLLKRGYRFARFEDGRLMSDDNKTPAAAR
jgi:peptidoglycan/xylan/chitin deacetylase (PgdA/CDA1 family)